jgi:protein SCO1/2
MKARLFKKLIMVVMVLCSYIANASQQLPYYNEQSFTPQWLSENSPELDSFHKIPSFSFVNQNGETITEKTFENKIYVAGFFFSTCPGICPTVRSQLTKVQESFAEDEQVLIAQHSIRPSNDTQEVLQAYALKNGIDDDKWHLLTGDKEAIYALAKTAYFASEDLGNAQKANDFLHTESLLLIDSNKHIRGIYNGLNSGSVDYLIQDIALLKSVLNNDN